MVTYCSGSIAAKRKAFIEAVKEGTVYIDNDEVLATYNLDKMVYVVVGNNPYGNMSAEQFVACNRALFSRTPLNRKAVKQMLADAGLRKSPKRKLYKLDRIEFRAACIASKVKENTTALYVNFDSLEYSSKNNKKLKKYLADWSRLYDVFVAVSDTRFIPKNAAIATFGEDVSTLKRTYSQKRVKMQVLQRKLSKRGMDIKLPASNTVIMSDSI